MFRKYPTPAVNIFCYFSTLLLFLQFCAQRSAAQDVTDWADKYWNAWWINMPGQSGHEYGVYDLRRTFNLDDKPNHFPIRVSADNRYRLYINGIPAGYGPAQGSPQNWFYDTYDIAPLLREGKNVIAAEVWNYGSFGPWVQMSVKTGFVLQSEKFRLADTDTSWRIVQDTGYAILPIDYRKVWDFIIVTPGDEIDGRKQHWGWQQTDYDDSKWARAKRVVKAAPYGTGTDLWWQLVPRTVPYLDEDTLRFKQARLVSGAAFSSDIFASKKDAVIPPQSHITILLDQGAETTSIPQIEVSGGIDATIVMSYAESLMNKNHDKGNRNVIEGKELLGVSDRFICDGGNNRTFCPLWFRAWRYLELDFQTGRDSLVIHDLYARFQHPRHPVNATFETSNDTLNQILSTAWHTQEICTKDYLLTDAYYEQLQYIGDNRIQSLLLNSMGYDSALVKNTIRQYFMSRIPEGLTQSRFPCAVPQVIPTYSLLWICVLHDYWMYYHDDSFLQEMIPAVQSIIAWYDQHIDPKTRLTGRTPFFNFVDWTKEWTWDNDRAIGGVPSGANNGGSSIISMQLAYTLRKAADLYNYLGDRDNTVGCRKRSLALTNSVWRLCWDNKRQLVADDPGKTIFSQHANVFAVLTNVIPHDKQRSFIQRIAFDSNLIQCSVYFRFIWAKRT